MRFAFETRDFTEERDALVAFAGGGIGGSIRHLGNRGRLPAGGSGRRPSPGGTDAAYRIGGGGSVGRHGGAGPGVAALAGGARDLGALGETGEGPDLSASLRQGFRISRDLVLKADVSLSVTRGVDEPRGLSPSTGTSDEADRFDGIPCLFRATRVG